MNTTLPTNPTDGELDFFRDYNQRKGMDKAKRAIQAELGKSETPGTDAGLIAAVVIIDQLIGTDESMVPKGKKLIDIASKTGGIEYIEVDADQILP